MFLNAHSHLSTSLTSQLRREINPVKALWDMIRKVIKYVGKAYFHKTEQKQANKKA